MALMDLPSQHGWQWALAPLAGWPELAKPRALSRVQEFASRFLAWRAQRETLRLLHRVDAATLRDLETGEETRVRARYVVAADGNRSPTRQRLGIEMEGYGELSRRITIYFKADCAPLLQDRIAAGVANGSLTLHSTNLPLLEDVQLILLGFGVQSAILPAADQRIDQRTDQRNNPRNGEDGVPAGEGTALACGGMPGRQAAQDVPGPRGDAEVMRHGLRIDPGSLRSFGKHIGLLPGRKLEQLAGAISFAIARPAADGNWDRVATLTPLGRQQVFDLTEPLTASA